MKKWIIIVVFSTIATIVWLNFSYYYGDQMYDAEQRYHKSENRELTYNEMTFMEKFSLGPGRVWMGGSGCKRAAHVAVFTFFGWALIPLNLLSWLIYFTFAGGLYKLFFTSIVFLL